MNESIFQVRVQKLRRIAIPKQICEALNIGEGDKVEVVIRKAELIGGATINEK